VQVTQVHQPSTQPPTRVVLEQHVIGNDHGGASALLTLDDFTDDDLAAEDHAWLDQLTRECALDFAAAQGYDLKDYIHGGLVADWWGFTWMILAEVRGVLTPQKRAAAWCRHGERTWWA
jgi:hypothetical protein